MKEYLTENKLKEELQKIYPDYEFIHNKIIPGCDFKYRPDFRCDELKLIIEFDGYRHYTKSSVIFSDYEKDYLWSNIYDYTVIRIPYFIQLCEDLLVEEFNLSNIKYEQTYPHGFIDSKACLPADFCSVGYDRFIEDLDRFNYLFNDIITSLNDIVVKRDHPYTVVPNQFNWPKKFWDINSKIWITPHIH